MGYSNGKVTAPLSIGDVAKAIGASLNDVGQVCTSPKINGFARYRPVLYAKIGPLTYRERLTANGMRYYYADTEPNQFASPGAALTYVGTFPAWVINEKPAGGTAQVFRLTDFEGYNHKAKWVSFTNITFNNSVVATLGHSTGLSTSKQYNTVLMTLTDEMMRSTVGGAINDMKAYINFHHYVENDAVANDSIVWWAQACVADTLKPVAMLWQRTGEDVTDGAPSANTTYSCFAGSFSSKPTNQTENQWKGSIEIGDGALGGSTDLYNFAKKWNFLIGLFPSATTFPNNRNTSNAKFRLPPVISTGLADGINKPFALWGGVIEKRDLRLFVVRDIYNTDRWLTRWGFTGTNYGGEFNPNMVQYKQIGNDGYNYGSTPQPFSMFADAQGDPQRTDNNYMFAWKRIVLEVTLGNPTDSAVSYSKFKVTCGSNTQYVAAVILSGGHVVQEPGDGNNVDMTSTIRSLSIPAKQNVYATFDLGFITESGYSLGGEEYRAAALSTSGNVRNPYVSNTPSGVEDKTFTIKATKGSTEVMLAQFTLKLKYS